MALYLVGGRLESLLLLAEIVFLGNALRYTVVPAASVLRLDGEA